MRLVQLEKEMVMVHFLGLLPYAVGITVAILLPAIIIARQEIAIEGPFGWSALTFTQRFPINHWFSKVYRFFTGKDKWATEYHLTSNIIWLFMYFLSFLYIPTFSKLAGYSNGSALVGTFVLAIASFVGMISVEDFIWFLIHPYYGPDRHNPEYVPWFTSWKGGIPVGYWASASVALVITGMAAIFLRKPEIFIIWLMVTVLVIVACFGIIRPLSRNMHREPLEKYWWKNVKYVIVERCPYALEADKPFDNAHVQVISEKTFVELVAADKARSLSATLEGYHIDES